MPDGIDLDVLFAETERRRLGEDFTFRHRNVHWQVEAAEAHDLRPQQHVTIEHPARARRLVPSPRITHGAGSRAWSANLRVADADAPFIPAPGWRDYAIHLHRARGHFYCT